MERVGRVSRFTNDGEVLLTSAREILQAHDNALQRFAVRNTETAITVAATERSADVVLPLLAQLLRRERPGVTVNFHLQQSAHVLDSLAAGGVDIAVYLQLWEPRVNVSGPAVSMTWYAGPEFVFDPGQVLPLVVYAEPCSSRTMARAVLHQHGIAHAIAVESSDLSGVTAAVRAGLGVCLLPDIGRPPELLRRVAELPEVAHSLLQVTGAPECDPALVAAIRLALADVIGSTGSAEVGTGHGGNVHHIA